MLAAVILLAAGWLIVGQMKAQSGLAQIQRRGVLWVGLDASFPPFEALNAQGQVFGLDADIAHAIAADLGVEVAFVNIGFDGLYDALKAGKVDLLISGLPADAHLTQDVAYSQPYFNAGLMLVTTRADIHSVADLAGQTVAVEWGSLADMEARQLRRTIPTLQIDARPDSASALGAEIAIVDGVSALLNPQVKMVATLSETWYVAAVAVDNQALLQRVNRTLDRLKQDAPAPCGLRVPHFLADYPPELSACYQPANGK